ncbi:DM DNA binding domain protein [Dictyocaulus viviparus]|uniref:DM DNA binding domain protein n=1 Tax=Dictyocaulus viviparus TaxID=29172 RepID=A0A0D8YFG5_DICVI|nr:DM DNA binding domain protein [Dictyocaulus viviparus]
MLGRIKDFVRFTNVYKEMREETKPLNSSRINASRLMITVSDKRRTVSIKIIFLNEKFLASDGYGDFLKVYELTNVVSVVDKRKKFAFAGSSRYQIWLVNLGPAPAPAPSPSPAPHPPLRLSRRHKSRPSYRFVIGEMMHTFQMPKEQYMCQLCANHGIFNQPKKGHKQKCPHRDCTCNLCALNTKRRALDQIERQLKNATHESRIDPTTSISDDVRIVHSDYGMSRCRSSLDKLSRSTRHMTSIYNCHHKITVFRWLPFCGYCEITSDDLITFASRVRRWLPFCGYCEITSDDLITFASRVRRASSIQPPYSVALPATITRREIRDLLRDEIRGYSRVELTRTSSTSSQQRTRPYRSLKIALSNIQRNRSIFHSAEQLAAIDKPKSLCAFRTPYAPHYEIPPRKKKPFDQFDQCCFNERLVTPIVVRGGRNRKNAFKEQVDAKQTGRRRVCADDDDDDDDQEEISRLVKSANCDICGAIMSNLEMNILYPRCCTTLRLRHAKYMIRFSSMEFDDKIAAYLPIGKPGFARDGLEPPSA